MTQFDWTAVLALGSLGTLLITFYRWVWVPHQARVNKEKIELYRPLVQEISSLMKSIEEFNIDAILQSSKPEEKFKDRLSPSLFTKLNRLSSKTDEFIHSFWASKASIDLMIYKICITRRDLLNEFKENWGGELADELSNILSLSLMKGVQLSKSWISDHTDLDAKMAKLGYGHQFHRIITEISNNIKHADRQRLLSRLIACQIDAVLYGKSILPELKRLAS